MTNLIDSHTHAEFFFEQGTEKAMRTRAREAGVVHALNVGTGTKDWELYARATREHPDFYSFSVGLHPCHVEENWFAELGAMEAWPRADHPKPVAWGEMGLDYFHLPKDKTVAATVVARQKQAFARQLKFTHTHPLPLIIHCREAFDDTVRMLDEAGVDWSRVVFHCFTYGPKEIRALLERGGRASFTGIITYNKTEAIQEALCLQGLDLLMVETDAPWLSPQPVRKEKNEPAHLIHIAEAAATLFGVSPALLGEVTTRNAREFFHLPES